MSITFVSLFTGIGGLDRGLEMATMQCVAQVESDPYAIKILEKEWPAVPKIHDIRDAGAANLPRSDFIVGGDPCQRNSNAWRHGTGDESLGGEFIRILDECRPRFVLRENPSVVRRDAPWSWQHFRSELERLGYIVLPFRLRACCVGAQHRRERLFLLGELQDTNESGLERNVGQVVARANIGRHDTYFARSDRGSATPQLRGKPHGVPHWKQRLIGLGNAVDVGVAEHIGQLIVRNYQESIHGTIDG